MVRNVRQLWGLAALAVAGFVAFLWVERRVDDWFYPWSDEGSGKPTLTGTWVGALTTGSGQPRGVLLEMRRWRPRRRGRCNGCATIEGRALMCERGGPVRRYRAGGKPENRSGSPILVGTAPDTDPPPDGLTLTAVRGTWEADSLRLEAQFSWRSGGAGISDSDDPDTSGWVPLPMTRGTEESFRSLCRRIAG